MGMPPCPRVGSPSGWAAWAGPPSAWAGFVAPAGPGADEPGRGFRGGALGSGTCTWVLHWYGGRMKDNRPDYRSTTLLGDLYRLGQYDAVAAVQGFQMLIQSGYSYENHRSVLATLEPHLRKVAKR